MEIFYSTKFKKRFNKLSLINRKRVEECLLLFEINPLEPTLRFHQLTGQMQGYYSISASYNLRLILIKQNNFLKILFIDVGTHNQVY